MQTRHRPRMGALCVSSASLVIIFAVNQFNMGGEVFGYVGQFDRVVWWANESVNYRIERRFGYQNSSWQCIVVLFEEQLGQLHTAKFSSTVCISFELDSNQPLAAAPQVHAAQNGSVNSFRSSLLRCTEANLDLETLLADTVRFARLWFMTCDIVTGVHEIAWVFC